MDVCILTQGGEILLPRTMKPSPETLLQAMAPYREALVVAVEGLFPWSWLADRCAQEHMPFVLGHALYLKAIHGGKANHDTSDSPKLAVLLRGGRLPQAYVYPAERRATRDLRRRRLHLTRQRAELRAHVQQTNSQYNRPEIGKQLAYKANRDGVAARCRALAVQKSVEVDLALIDYADQLLRDVEWPIVQTAKQPQAQTLYRLHSIPGLGQLLSVVLLDAMQAITRFPRGQDCVSSCRLVKCAKDSAGKRYGTSGAKLGTPDRQGACSAAAVLFLRNNPAAQKYLIRLESNHGTGKALTMLAHKLARAVYYRLNRETTFNMQKFLNGSGSGAGAPTA